MLKNIPNIMSPDLLKILMEKLMAMKITTNTVLIVLLAGLGCHASAASQPINDSRIAVVHQPSTETVNNFYIGNRQPLLPSPLIKLPIRAIEPQELCDRQRHVSAGLVHDETQRPPQ